MAGPSQVNSGPGLSADAVSGQNCYVGQLMGAGPQKAGQRDISWTGKIGERAGDQLIAGRAPLMLAAGPRCNGLPIRWAP
jgi:hypothetical protein